MMISLIFASLMTYALAVPVQDETTTKELRAGMGKFSLELTRALLQSSKPDENVLLSPVNIYAALSMATMGAGSKTREQLAATLGFPAKNDADYNNMFEQLGSMLDSVTKNEKANVSMANAMFIAPKFPVKDAYKSDLQKIFHSDVYTADFAKGGSEAAEIVNKWVSEKTHNRIDKLFNGEAPTEIVALLASALYFHAKWKNEFKVYETITTDFNASPVSKFPVQMMTATNYARYLDHRELLYQSIELPYQDEEFNMYVVLPYKEQNIQNLTKHLTVNDLSRISKENDRQRVRYSIPKFKFKREIDLTDVLSDIGIKDAFSGDADFNKISEKMKISKAKHIVEIESDESGTIGSAITALEFVPISLTIPNQPIIFYADRPFIFYIQHSKTKFIAFSAIVNNPNAKN